MCMCIYIEGQEYSVSFSNFLAQTLMSNRISDTCSEFIIRTQKDNMTIKNLTHYNRTTMKNS